MFTAFGSIFINRSHQETRINYGSLRRYERNVDKKQRKTDQNVHRILKEIGIAPKHKQRSERKNRLFTVVPFVGLICFFALRRCRK